MSNINGRLGFCCKWISPTGDFAAEELLNQTSTTITALSRKTQLERETQLLDLVANNLDSANRLIEWVGAKPKDQRMLRLTSEMLPGYTHETTSNVYQLATMQSIMEAGFAKLGSTARILGVRISFHPGQFCVINSLNPGVYQRSVAEFEYHVLMMQMMGYGGSWHSHGSTINIHTGGKEAGIAGFVKGLKGLSTDALNLITVENDEFSFGLSELEPLADKVAIVLDIHHEWIHSKGNFIQVDDPRIDYVKASWRGVRPLGHYSTSPESVLKGHATDKLPDFKALLAGGLNRKDLRAHSNMCWNSATNDWALSHLSWMDIEVEAKSKNLASEQLFKQSQNKVV